MKSTTALEGWLLPHEVQTRQETEAAIAAITRLRGQLHNSTPRRQNFQLTRQEVEALIGSYATLLRNGKVDV